MKALLAPLLVLAVLLAGCTTAPDAAPNEVDEDGRTIGPDWSFVDTDGVEHSRDSSMGAPSVLFFMATWCSSCRSNTPRIAEVHDDFEARGLHVYSVSWDPTETAADLEQWKEQYGQPWPHGTDPGSAVASTFGITSQSSYAILDADGILVKRLDYPGARSVTVLEGAVEDAYAASAQA